MDELTEELAEKVAKKKLRRYHDMEESLANLVQQLGEGEPQVLADISKEEHNALAVASAYADWLESSILRGYVAKFLKLSPARKGVRAKQLTAIGIANRSDYSEDDKFFSKIKRKLHIGE